jgi:hypothetical protein
MLFKRSLSQQTKSFIQLQEPNGKLLLKKKGQGHHHRCLGAEGCNRKANADGQVA